MITALTVIGISIAIVSPRENHAFSAFATNLQKPVHLSKEYSREEVKKKKEYCIVGKDAAEINLLPRILRSFGFS